jgi:hypothetical protein
VLVDQARQQLLAVKTITDDRAPMGMAICFVCPMVSSIAVGMDIFEALRSMFDESPDAAHVLAVYEPPVGSQLEDVDPQYGRRYYPGVALWAEYVRPFNPTSDIVRRSGRQAA